MNTDEIRQFIDKAYSSAMALASGKNTPVSSLSAAKKSCVDIVVQNAESSKAIATVVLTSLVYKCINPNQDVRKHQSSIEGGYSGRTFDSNHITPFMKRNNFPAMSESGWLTRSLEQKVPYDRNYTGAIKPVILKKAFLDTMEAIEDGKNEAELMLDYMLQALIIQRDKNQLSLAIPRGLTIASIISLLDKHFHANYKAIGASRLPVLALYALYSNIVLYVERYRGKRLLPLEKHNSSDMQSGRIGDIDIVEEQGEMFEAVEVKFDIKIDHNIVITAKNKILPTGVKTYYILSTKETKECDQDAVAQEIAHLHKVHGCQLIVNGILPTIKYYLRLLPETSMFLQQYTQLLNADDSVKFEHKNKWNELIISL